MFREARRGLKATVGNRVNPDYHFIRIVFCSFLFLSARFLCSLAGYAQKHVNTNWRLWVWARLKFGEHIQGTSGVFCDQLANFGRQRTDPSPSLADLPAFVRTSEIYFFPEHTQNASRWNLSLLGLPQSFYNGEK